MPPQYLEYMYIPSAPTGGVPVVYTPPLEEIFGNITKYLMTWFMWTPFGQTMQAITAAVTGYMLQQKIIEIERAEELRRQQEQMMEAIQAMVALMFMMSMPLMMMTMMMSMLRMVRI